MNIDQINEILNEIMDDDKPKKIGIDIHGVITDYPIFFSKIIKELMDKNHEVHIVTGARLSSKLIKNLLSILF